MKPTPRSSLVKAVREAAAIVSEALPVLEEEDRQLYAALAPVILRELLDYEIEET